MKIYNRAQWFLYSILSNYPGALSPAPTSSLAPAHPRTLLLANLVLLLLKWFTWLTMRPKPSYLHQSPKALALAVWPPTRQKLVRPSSQVTFFPITLVPMANEDGLSQAMNTWAEDIRWAFDSHPIAASGQAEVKVPSHTPNYCPIGKYTQAWINLFQRFIGQPYCPLPSLSAWPWGCLLTTTCSDRQEHQPLNYKGLEHTKNSSTNWLHLICNHDETTWAESWSSH